jgi:outer membrane protein assembly factor BamA/autotransporter translocation and assembly factor TamB
MTADSRPVRRVVRYLMIAALALGASAAALVVLVHLPPVRAAVLRRAAALLEEQYGLRLEARRLDYRLWSLEAELHDVRLTALDDDTPLLEARRVAARVAERTLLGQFALERVELEAPVVRVIQRADGSSNLPPRAGGDGEQPAALDLELVEAFNLAVEYTDEAGNARLRVPDATIILAPSHGRIALNAPAELQFGDTTIQVTNLDGDAAFDGRDLHFTMLTASSEEGRLSVSGMLQLLRSQPSMALTFIGELNTAVLTRRLLGDDRQVEGRVAVDGQAQGALDEPQVALAASSDRLAWRDVIVTDVMAIARVTGRSLEVERLSFEAAGGRIDGSGRFPMTTPGDARVDLAWSGIDLATVAAWAGPATVVPANTTDGNLTASGPLDDIAAWQGDAAISTLPAANRRGRLSAPGTSRLRFASRRWRLEGAHVLANVAPVRVALTGVLAPEGLGRSIMAGTADLDSTDLGALADALRTAGLFEPPDPPPSGRIEGRAAVSGTLGAPRASFIVTSDRIDVARQAFAAVAGRGDVDASRVVVDELSALAGDGEVPSGRIQATGEYQFSDGRYRAVGNIERWRLAGDDPTYSAVVDGRFDVQGVGEDLRGTAQIAVDDATVSGIALGPITADIGLEGRQARMTARAPELNVSAEADMSLTAPYQAVGTITARNLDVSRFAAAAGTALAVAGTVDAEMKFEGPASDWRSGLVTAEVPAFDLRLGELPIRAQQPLMARVDGGRLFVDRLEAGVGDTHLAASGSLEVFDAPSPRAGGPLIVTLDGDLDAVLRAVSATGLTTVPIAGGSGPAALLAVIDGSLAQPLVTADLELGPGVVRLRDDLPEVRDVRLRARADGGVLDVREASATFEGARLEATARAPLDVLWSPDSMDGRWELRLRATNVTPAMLRPFVEAGALEQIEGAIEATAELTGSSASLTDAAGEIRLDGLDLLIAGLPIRQRAPTRLTVGNGLARVDSWNWEGEGATLDLQGQVHLLTRQAALLADGIIDLRLLTPFVRAYGLATAGRFETHLSVTGPIDDVRVDGSAVVSGGEIRVTEPRLVISDLSVQAVLSRSSAHMTSLTAAANGAPMTAKGEAAWRADSGLSLRVESTVEGMPIEIVPGLQTELDADLTYAFTAAPDDEGSGRISGMVTIVRGAYREQIAVLTGLLTRLRTSALTTPPAEAGPSGGPINLDLRVVTEEDLVVDNNLASVQLGADLRVIGTLERPVLFGRAEVREAGQLYLGRNVYTLQSGTFDFANPTSIDPEMSILASTRVLGVDIEVRLTGTLSNPNAPELTSEDSDFGEADLASLLLTGRLLDDLATEEAAVIGAQVLGNLSGDVLGLAGRVVGLDVVRLGDAGTMSGRNDPTAVATAVDPTTRLTFGKSLGTKLDVTYSQSLRDGAAQTWIVDYLPVRRLGLRLISNDEDLRTYEFRHEVLFGGSPPAARRPGRQRTSPVVTGVTIRGNLVVPEERIRRTLRLSSGRPFDFIRWQNDRDRLVRLYASERRYSAQISGTRMETESGVELIYEIDAGPETRVSVHDAQVPDSVVRGVEELWAESTLDSFLVDEAATLVRRHLQENGYLDARVAARFIDEPGVRTLVLDVETGVRATAVELQVDAADEELRTEVEAWLSSIGSPARAAIDPAAVERGLLEFLRQRGYMAPRVSIGSASFEGTGAIIPVTVMPGPQFTIGNLAFEGVNGVNPALVQEVSGLATGLLHDAGAIELARTEVQALYRREGFPNATVAVRQTVRDNVVDVRVVVEEGPRQVVGPIDVAGHRSATEEFIVRTVALEPGMPLRTADWLAARRRLFDTGLFRRVDIAADAVEEGDGAAVVPMRIRVTVEEWPSLRLRYGFQAAEERPLDEVEGRDLVPGISADLVRRTLFRRPISVGGAFDLRTRDQEGRVFARVPTLFGLPVESLLTVNRSRRPIGDSERIDMRTGVAWEQQVRIRQHLRAAYSYRFERSRTDLPPDEFLGPLPPVIISLGRLVASAAWDSRNDPSDTSRGTLVSSVLEYAPEALGSDIRFVKTLTQAYHFRPWRGVVLASAARVGTAQALGGQDLILSERFFAGGSRTVRGVPEGSLGERDFLDEAIGGEGLIVLNQEVRIPLHPWFRAVGFVDAGNAFATLRDMSLRGLVGSTGVGLRIVTPVVMVRVDYGRVVWNGSGHRWTFGIGQAF